MRESDGFFVLMASVVKVDAEKFLCTLLDSLATNPVCIFPCVHGDGSVVHVADETFDVRQMVFDSGNPFSSFLLVCLQEGITGSVDFVDLCSCLFFFFSVSASAFCCSP